MKTRLLFVIPLLVSVLLVASPNSFAQQVPLANVPFDINNIPEPIPPPAAVRDFFQLDLYYQQWINVRGYPVLASAEVRPYTVKEIAWNIGQMIRHRPDILRAMAQNRARFAIVPQNKHLPDIPEYDFGRLDFFWELRARGVGGLITSSAEDSIICGDPNYCSGEVVHEFAHQLHFFGLNKVDPTFDSRLETLYNMAIAEGLYQDRYAGTNRFEYWAEGIGSWFDTPNERSVSPTRVALKAYDPRLAELITEVFGDPDWRYTPPAARTHLPHLQGFNPEEAPIYQRPARLSKLDAQLKDPDSNGEGKWVNLKLHDPNQLPRLLNSAARENSNRTSTDLIFVNLTGTNISLYFFDADGRKNFVQRIDFNYTPFNTWVGAIWLIKDHTGKDLAVVRAEEQVGRVLIPTVPPFESLPISIEDVVLIPDVNLAAAVRKALGLGRNAPITKQAMQRLTELDARNSQIKNLTGLEHATRLVQLALFHNQIQNVNSLKGLTQLQRLYCQDNQITDITPLAKLTQLKRLHLWGNRIRDISVLGGLTKLESLWLESNQIRDISPLAGLTQLTDLTLGGNPIQDISPLRTLLNRDPNLDLDIEVPPLSPVVRLEAAQRPPLYWVDETTGTFHRLIGDEVENLVPNVRNATDLAIDMPGGKLYWTERTSDHTGRIRRANLNGTNVQLVKELTSVPHGIALDAAGDKIYLTNSWGKVQRLNVDGSNFESNLITDLEDLKDIAVDVVNHKIYWTEGKNRIRRANLDGSNIQTSATDLGTLGGIAIADGKLYWTKQIGENAGRIQCANLDGTNIQTLISLRSIPLGITIDSAGRTLYWTSSQGTIQRANLNGSNIQVLVFGLGAPAGIALGTPDDIVGTEAPLDKITGPWLWMIAPTETGQGGANSTNVDSLAAASGGNVTEADVAANGAKKDNTVGDYAWTLGEIAAHGSDNVNDVINNIGMAQGDVDDHSAYALITLESIKVQSGVTMRVGSDDSIKVWINGKVVHNNPINRGAQDFQDTFKVNLNKGDNLLLVKVSDLSEHWTMFVGLDADVKTKTVRAAPLLNATDINKDGKVDKIDLLLVVTVLGENSPTNPRTDVNDDGTVNVADLLLVIGSLDDPVSAAAPASGDMTVSLDPATLTAQLNILRAGNDGSLKYQWAIAFLQNLLAARPNETRLLANYPNPFNPETWIPYQLSEAADVRLNIYSATGTLIRTFELGHQPAGIYQNRSRAAYWDGRNELGEKVASGVYFYTLSAGGFTATRKMLIRK